MNTSAGIMLSQNPDTSGCGDLPGVVSAGGVPGKNTGYRIIAMKKSKNARSHQPDPEFR